MERNLRELTLDEFLAEAAALRNRMCSVWKQCQFGEHIGLQDDYYAYGCEALRRLGLPELDLSSD